MVVLLLFLILLVLVFGANKIMDGIAGCTAIIIIIMFAGVLVVVGKKLFGLIISFILNWWVALGLIILSLMVILYLLIKSLFKSFDNNDLNQNFLNAVERNQTAIAVSLLKEKPNVNIFSENNYVIKTPLMIAADNGNIELVRKLIKSKANVNARNPMNWTPLMFATRNGHIGVVRELIKSKAKTNIINKKGETAYDIAIRNDFDEIAHLLFNAGKR